MTRTKRTKNEIRQFGLPTDQDRITALEELVKAMLAAPSMHSINASDKKAFEDHQAKMDRIDIDYPVNKR